MYKLVILIGEPPDPELFDEQWPLFLQWAEQMPGLRQETTSWLTHKLFGSQSFTLMHELYFDSLEDAEKALKSTNGQRAGETLQWITGGRLALFLGDHHADNLENINRLKGEAK